MQKIVKALLGLFILAGGALLAFSLYASADLDRYASLSPNERAEEGAAGRASSEAARQEALRGTDCEKLTALSCYEMRRQRKNLEAAAEAYAKSDLKKAVDDAGVR